MLAQRDDALEQFFNFSTRRIRMSSRVPEAVRCHTEYNDRIAQLVHSDTTSIATADSGADTNVLGRDWLIVLEDPFRWINLVGFDAAHAQKHGLHCYDSGRSGGDPSSTSVSFEPIYTDNPPF
jgi:hypothetical protein